MIRLGSAPIWAYGLPVLGMLSLAVATLIQEKAHRTRHEAGIRIEPAVARAGSDAEGVRTVLAVPSPRSRREYERNASSQSARDEALGACRFR